MTNQSRFLTRFVLILALVVLAAGPEAARAQGVLTGDWKASVDQQKPEEIHLSFEGRGERGHKSQTGTNFNFADLRGLSRGQTSGGGVKFSIVREAGTIDCEGSFQNGRGSGTFRFTGNPGFVSSMRSKGFDFDKNASEGGRDHTDRLFTAAALNITTALADDLLSADFGKLDVDDLFKAAIFKVDSRFMREMKASGFPGLGMEELVRARIFKIDADFVGKVARMNLDKASFDGLVRMQIFKVTPEFVAEVRDEGLRDLSVEDLVQMRIFKIDGEFIRRAKSDGVPLEVEELVRRRIGVRGR